MYTGHIVHRRHIIIVYLNLRKSSRPINWEHFGVVNLPLSFLFVDSFVSRYVKWWPDSFLYFPVLDFAIQVLRKGAAADDIISPLVIFSVQYIMVNHMNWKHKKYSRWKTTLRVKLLIFLMFIQYYDIIALLPVNLVLFLSFLFCIRRYLLETFHFQYFFVCWYLW